MANNLHLGFLLHLEDDDEFKTLPLVAFRRILYFLTFKEIKLLRRVSPWFFERVSNEFKQRFGTYKIEIRRLNFVKIQRTLAVAMERPYGLDIKLNLDLQQLDSADALQLIKSCNETLTELKLKKMNVLNVAVINSIQLPNLKVLHLDRIKNWEAVLALINSCKEALTELKMVVIDYLDIAVIKSIQFPNLKVLHLERIEDGNAVLALINSCQETLTELKLVVIYDLNVDYIKSIQLPNLKVLHLEKFLDENAVLTLINSCKDTLTLLKLVDIYCLNVAVIKSIQFPNLKVLHLERFQNGNAALSLINSCKETLTELKINHISETYLRMTGMNAAVINSIQLPNLKVLHLESIKDKNAVLALIISCKDSITELEVKQIKNLSKDEINNIKTPNLEILKFEKYYYCNYQYYDDYSD